MSNEAFAIGLDIGGGSTKIGLVSRSGAIVDRGRVLVGPRDNAETILQRYAEAIGQMTGRNRQRSVEGIGIGFPGRIRDGNRLGHLSNIPALDDFPLADRIADRFDLPARMENDGTAAGLAEALFGNVGREERVLLIALGTGIGVAFAVKGRPFVTASGGLGDAGHMLVQFDRPTRCRQGCLGCLESVASADALNQMLATHVRNHPDGALARRSAAESRAPDASDIVICARAGDATSVEMLRTTGQWIGRAAASWTHVFAPTVILLGGGLSAAGDLLLRPIEDEARRLGLDDYLRDVSFSLASLGNDAGMIGAAAQIFLDTHDEGGAPGAILPG